MNDPTQEQSPQTIPPPAFSPTLWQKFLYGFLVIAAPIFDFWIVEGLKPDWQTGRFSDYINLLLLPEASIYFFPLLAYAVISYILFLWDTDRFSRLFIVRLGIYTGTFLALQYSILTMLAADLPLNVLLIILVFLFPIVISRIYRWLSSKLTASLTIAIGLGIGFVALILAMIILKNPASPFFLILFFFGVGAPFWSFFIATQAALWLFKHREIKTTLPRGLGILAWLSAYAYALRFDILKMYELYAALPTEPPDCYIATAAAKGHPCFVGSREIVLANGKSMQVNRQLQRLKTAELALMVVAPRVHAVLRRIYDSVGKKLGSRINHPINADAAYLILKPFELLSSFFLGQILKEYEEITHGIYSREKFPRKDEPRNI